MGVRKTTLNVFHKQNITNIREPRDHNSNILRYLL